jgi:hypothetical protein
LSTALVRRSDRARHFQKDFLSNGPSFLGAVLIVSRAQQSQVFFFASTTQCIRMNVINL